MKMRKIAAGMAAAVLAASTMAISAFAETKYYVWGGEQVGWSMDLDNDDTNNEDPDLLVSNQFPGYGKDGYEKFWVGTLDANEGKATLTIPVVKGATVDFIAGGWEDYPGVQYSVTIGDVVGEVKWDPLYPDDPKKLSKPTFTYEVTDDVTEITAEIYYYDRTEDDVEDPLYNEYCQGFVHVNLPGGDDADSTAEEPSEAESEAGSTESEAASEADSEADSTAEVGDQGASTEDSKTESTGDASSAADTTSSAADSSASTTGSTTAASNNNSGSTTTASTGSTTTAASNNGTAASTNSTANPAASSDNKATGAAAGIALAGIAVAGAAFVVTKKK